MAAFGRLEPGVSLDQARADLSAIAVRLGEDFPQTNAGYGVELIGFPEWIKSEANMNSK